MQPITIRYEFRPRRRSVATGQVADLFGLADTEPPHVVAENVALDIRPGDVALVTGPSGSGKSSILRAAGQQLNALDAHAVDLPNKPLIDALRGPVEVRLDNLSACGLSEARLLLRTPTELSDGQRYRFRLAYALDQMERVVAARSPDRAAGPTEGLPIGVARSGDRAITEKGGQFLLADEFAAMLDRTLATVLAFNIRKLATRTGVGFLLATTHEDLAEDLNPDLHVRCRGDAHVEVERRNVKKKALASRTSFGSRKAPQPTGRISLGGIIAATTSPSCVGLSCSGTAASRSAS
ncbi:MAG TPA: hypothetical protein VKS79_05590 [Gemmataceae bacterium]|nr:hypothetical protein [Gemmataceae bacterium]